MLPLVSSCAIVLLLAWQGIPALPALEVSSFPGAARDALARAHGEALRQPDDAAAVGALGRVLHAWEQWEAAHSAYARAAALDPKALDWPYLDAVVLQRLMRPADAVSRLTAALALDSQYLPARVRLAEALFDAGDLDGSAARFEALAGEPRAEPAARVGLGRIAAARGSHEEAVRQFQKAIALFPDLGMAYYGLARSYRALGRADEAQRALEQHARLGPRWPRIDDPLLASVADLREDARALVQRGVAAAAEGDLARAIADHEAALRRDPALSQAHANLVSLYGRSGNPVKAEEHYRAALAAGLDNAELHYDYGLVLAAQEQWDGAAAAYRKAISVNPLHAEARNNLGQALERVAASAAPDRQRAAFEEAAREYEAAIEARPGLRVARFNHGRMLLALGRNEEALARFEQLRTPRDAEAPRYLFALATVYVRTGRLDLARQHAADARDLAIVHGQTDLAAAIDRELARLR